MFFHLTTISSLTQLHCRLKKESTETVLHIFRSERIASLAPSLVSGDQVDWLVAPSVTHSHFQLFHFVADSGGMVKKVTKGMVKRCSWLWHLLSFARAFVSF